MAENPMHRHKKLTILQQIEQLKNWHKQQQSKLAPENEALEEVDIVEIRSEISKDIGSHNVTDKQFKQNYLHSSYSRQNFDEIPIKVTNPNFNDYIENNIIPNETKPNESGEIGTKPKFKFLKRGEGIARFRMGPQKRPRCTSKNNQVLKLANITQTTNKNHQSEKYERTESEERTIKNRYDIPSLYPPNLKLDFKNWKSIFSSGTAEEIIEKAIDNNQLELFQPNSSIDSSTASIMEKLLNIGRKHLKDREELRVFETMEQHVMDSSFCSTSSYVAKLMENAVMSTPEKKSFPTRNNVATVSYSKQLPTVPSDDEDEENAVKKSSEQRVNNEIPIWKKPEISKSGDHKSHGLDNTEDLEQSLHVKFAEEVDYKSFIEYSQSLNKSDQKETNFGDFDESKEWKEESDKESSCCSECGTSYSSSDEDVRAISPPVNPPPGLQHLQTDRSSCQSYMQNNSKSPVQRLDLAELNANTETAGQKVQSNDGIDAFPPVLSAKLKNLEDEIEVFRAENNKLKALRENLEKERKQFQLEKKRILQEMEEEKKKNTAQLEEEKQKLAKEKLTFERYSKALTKNPTKEERKEIQGLRDQLNEMKEEMNKKESRWGAAQARVRNQVKLLEDDNRKLREEVEVLSKQAKHLEFLTQKKKGKPFNNTKLIHAINDHISNIPAEEDDITSAEVGYFNQKLNAVKTVVTVEMDPKMKNSVKVIKENGSKNPSLVVSNEGNHRMESSSKKVVNWSTEESSLLPEPVHFRDEQNSLKTNDSKLQENKHSLEKEGNPQKAFLEEHSPNSAKETINEDGNVERTFPDGRKEIKYKNGNVKKIDPITGNEKTIYFNGDVEEITRDGTVKYYFSESRIWHTKLSDGLEVLDFPNGQVEKRHTNGMVEVVYPNDCKKLTYPDGSEEIFYADGTTLKIEANKRKTLSLPNGQKEIHTEECVRREYPDGTVKRVYPDGTAETVYANGRVRLKDKHGNLVMDSGTLANSRL